MFKWKQTLALISTIGASAYLYLNKDKLGSFLNLNSEKPLASVIYKLLGVQNQNTQVDISSLLYGTFGLLVAGCVIAAAASLYRGRK